MQKVIINIRKLSHIGSSTYLEFVLKIEKNIINRWQHFHFSFTNI